MPITERVATDLPVTIKTSTYALLPSDWGREIQFESTTAVSANLPAVADAGNGYNVIIRNIGTGTLTIDPDGTEQIDGASTLSLSAGDWHWIRSDGTEWKSVSANGTGGGGGGSGAWELVASASASSDASIDFTGFDSGIYSSYMLIMEDVRCATDNVSVYIRTSANGGSSYDSGSTDYAYQYIGGTGTWGATHMGRSDGASFIDLTGANPVGNDTNEAFNGNFTIYAPGNASYTWLTGQSAWTRNDGQWAANTFSGIRKSAAAVDAIQFLFSSGNIASGTFRLLGQKV